MLKAAMIENPVLRAVQGIGMHLALSVPVVQRHMASFLSEDNITYRGGPLAPKSSGEFRPGDAFPDLDIDGNSATNLLRGNEATLLTSSIGTQIDFGKGGFPIAQVTSQAITEQIGGDVLVRPDGVVAAIGSDNIQQWLHDLVLAESFT